MAVILETLRRLSNASSEREIDEAVHKVKNEFLVSSHFKYTLSPCVTVVVGIVIMSANFRCYFGGSVTLEEAYCCYFDWHLDVILRHKKVTCRNGYFSFPLCRYLCQHEIEIGK